MIFIYIDRYAKNFLFFFNDTRFLETLEIKLPNMYNSVHYATNDYNM